MPVNWKILLMIWIDTDSSQILGQNTDCHPKNVASLLIYGVVKKCCTLRREKDTGIETRRISMALCAAKMHTRNSCIKSISAIDILICDGGREDTILSTYGISFLLCILKAN